MKRVYKPYTDWEEVEYGMYKNGEENAEEHIKNALKLLKSPSTLYHFMKSTVEEWPNSTVHNMTNPNRNKQAWLGQASCCLYAGVPEDITKQAWSLLTDDEREEANKVADKVIKEWEEQNA